MITSTALVFINRFVKRPVASGILIFLFLFITTIFLSFQRFQDRIDDDRIRMKNILYGINDNLEQALTICKTTTISLALSVNDAGIPEDFNKVSKQLIETNPLIYSLRIVPNGVIKYIYPMKGNETDMNSNVLSSTTYKYGAIQTLKNKKMYFSGPYKLRQGRIILIVRQPIYEENKFWGFASVYINLEKLLSTSGINTIDFYKYKFQFSSINPVSNKEEFWLTDKPDLSKNYFESYKIPDSTWKIYLIANQDLSYFKQIPLPAKIGLIYSILFGVLTTSILKRSRKLQVLINDQKSKILKDEIKYEALFENADIGIAIVDVNSLLYDDINGRLCKMLEYTEEEFKIKTLRDIIHPDDKKQSNLKFEELRKGDIRKYSFENRYFTKSGKTIWVKSIVSPLWKIDAKPTKCIKIVEDITSIKEADLLVKENEKRFKSLFYDSPISLWEEDFSLLKKYLEGLNLMGEKQEKVLIYLQIHPEVVKICIKLTKIIDANKKCLELYQVETVRELSNYLNNTLGKNEIADFTKIILAITQGENQLDIDSTIKNSKGEYRETNIKWNVVRGFENSIERVIVSTLDITELKVHEKSIMSSQHRVQTLIDTIDGIVWECDAITFASSFISKKVKNILGYSNDEWLSSTTFWQDHLHPQDQGLATSQFEKLNIKNSSIDFEYRMIAKNGKIVWIRNMVTYIYKNDTTSSLRGIMIDITKMKESEKVLNKSFNLVSDQNKRLLNFSYIVSHNLRSHSSNIQSIVSLIEASESEEETEEMITLLKNVTNTLNETLNNLNDVVNIQTNMDLVTEPLNLNQYIDKAIAVLKEQIIIKDAQIVNMINRDITLIYNPAYLESILFNIISNAIRYSHPERKPIITISFSADKENKTLKFSDNGIGIDLDKNGLKLFGMYKTFNKSMLEELDCLLQKTRSRLWAAL